MEEKDKLFKITATTTKDPNIGIDLNQELPEQIIEAAENSMLDVSALEGFANVAQTREQIYSLVDTMCNDSTIASVIETYAADATETNDYGKVLWCEAADPEIAKHVTYLLDSINVDKHMYGWAYSFIKYGDLYLRLFKQSEYEQETLFNVKEQQKTKLLNEVLLTAGDKYSNLTPEEVKSLINEKALDEAIKLKLYDGNNDRYVPYLEAVPNPGEMFELTRFGKTSGFISAPTNVQAVKYQTATTYNYFKYNIKRNDVNVYEATNFVHAALDDDCPRAPEEVNIYLNDNDYENNTNGLTYKVKRGLPLLYNLFKIWRELSLLEDSVLLNRITQSSIIRLIQVQVGDMPKEQIGPYLQKIKALMEQKAAYNAGTSMQEYTNPGPIANNIYIPVGNDQKGSITLGTVGGDVDPKQLTDLDWFNNKLFAGLRVPKQFFGFTDDAAGFNGGSSLSIISSRYGKEIKRIQNALIQAITDAINLLLLDEGLLSYINKFQLKMQAPITQEELDRRQDVTNRVRVVGDIMNTLSDITEPIARLKVLKNLISTVVSDNEILSVIQGEIDRLTTEAEEKEDKDKDKDKRASKIQTSGPDMEEPAERPLKFSKTEEEPVLEPEEPETETEVETSPETPEASGEPESYLPSFNELGIDGTTNA